MAANGGEAMKFSLIMATIGRVAEVERFLAHLDQQTHRDFELLIVDQNEDDRLLPLVHKYSARFTLLHLRSEKGVSLAKNVGLQQISGNFIAFPDDDCWYDSNVLERVLQMFRQYPQYSGITGRCIDANGNDAAAKFDKSSGEVNAINVWQRAVSVTMFFRRSVYEVIGGFDEEIGIGAKTPYWSGEETDYVLRVIRQFKVFYNAEFTVNHPNPVLHYTAQVIRRGYNYGCGFGKVVRKHQYSFGFKARALIRPFLGMMLYLIKLKLPRSLYYWNSFRGRLRGML
jgi:glycosyltransferase involved in cell wall biosynthesis